MPIDLEQTFGGIDIYLFDQLLKGRIAPGMQILDAGCGSGRNLIYFLKNGFSVFAVDTSHDAIEHVRRTAKATVPGLPAENFLVEDVAHMSFENDSFEVVLSSAVLHFAGNEEKWRAMVYEMWRVLRPGGIFFARLASSIGIENQIEKLDGRRYHLPDGSDRFLVDEKMLMDASRDLGGEFIEPIKTVVVQNMRSMTTWVLRKTK